MSRYVMHRGWQDHPLFDGDEYSRRDAWEWLISEAAWKETRKRVAGKIVVLRRGQLSHSIRFLAERWKWSKSRVDRFLTQLKSETMIETVGGTGQLIISICKYEAYQLRGGNAGTDTGTLFETPPGQNRDKEEEGKEGNKKKREETREPAHAILDYCQRRFNAPWLYHLSPIQAWVEWGADLEKDVKPVVEHFLQTRTEIPRSLKYLDDRIAASIRQRTQPMPTSTANNGAENARPSLFGSSAERDYDGDAKNSRFRIANPRDDEG